MTGETHWQVAVNGYARHGILTNRLEKALQIGPTAGGGSGEVVLGGDPVVTLES